MSANVSDPRAKAMAASRQLQEALLSASDALKTIAGIVPRLFPPNDSGSLGALLVASSTEIGRTDAAGATPSSHKRKRKEKDPDAPDKPPSAYHIYAKEKRDEIKEALGGAPSAAGVIQEINRRWKELADDLKKVV
jgi:HMG (high mobility group) box